MKNYREILTFCFEQRAKNLKKYSLRKFSLDLNLSATMVADIIKGRKKLPKTKIDDIAVMLTLNDDLTHLFKVSAWNDHLSKQQDQTKKIEKISIDEVKEMFFDLDYSTVLHLMQCQGYRHDVLWLSEKIGCAPEKILKIVSTLQNNEFINIENNQVKVLRPYFSSPRIGKNEVIREAHKKIIDKEKSLMDSTKLSDRAVKSIILPADSRLIGEARLILNECQEKIFKLMNKSTIKEDVYLLGMRFFPLTQRKNI